MTPVQVRAAVFDAIQKKPDTYTCLCIKLKDKADDRAIDRALQALRKKGHIVCRREGRFVVWHGARKGE